jgi:hypothetical protein
MNKTLSDFLEESKKAKKCPTCGKGSCTCDDDEDNIVSDDE